MSKKKASDSYEVGYGKPPKNSQFKKGVSGNPKGRPKKAPDFYAELMKASRSFITVNDNGKRIRISKLRGIVMQLMNKALTGDIRAMRILFSHYPQALEVTSLSITQQSSNPGKYDDVHNLTDEELMRLLVKNLPVEELERLALMAEELERKNGDGSNAD